MDSLQEHSLAARLAFYVRITRDVSPTARSAALTFLAGLASPCRLATDGIALPARHLGLLQVRVLPLGPCPQLLLLLWCARLRLEKFPLF